MVQLYSPLLSTLNPPSVLGIPFVSPGFVGSYHAAAAVLGYSWLLQRNLLVDWVSQMIMFRLLAKSPLLVDAPRMYTSRAEYSAISIDHRQVHP